MQRIGLAVVLIFSLVAPVTARAQQVKVYRIGVLSPFASSFGPGPSFEAFRQMLRELGYIEERDVVLEYRWGLGQADQVIDP
jgi:putative tryptophan/tyrosine transport system substrate-binding protein